MSHPANINIQEDNELKKIKDLIIKNYRLFILCTFSALCISFFINRYSIPSYSITSSVLIKGNSSPQSSSSGENDFLFRNLFGVNQNFQNELWIMKSYPLIEKTINNLDLTTTYFTKGKFNYYEAYKNVPFKVSFLSSHSQPINIKFDISFDNNGTFSLSAKSRNATFYNFVNKEVTHHSKKWSFNQKGKFGELIETPDLSFIIERTDTTQKINNNIIYGFDFSTIPTISARIRNKLNFEIVERQATVIKLSLSSVSRIKGIDILNELMSVYSEQNLDRKNYLASTTVSYIEKQLNEISDSLILTEDNLQRFRSSNQLLNITDQAAGISAQHLELQSQLDELVSRKRYYDYVSELLRNDNFSNMMLPASIGISDAILNNLVSELLKAQSQRSNLIENKQEKNPLVQKLGIEIENLKKTISENVSAISSSTSISIDEMNKRIKRVEAEINRLPATQRQLGTIERKYRLNDALYNYLMEKHAEAKITKASNLPDDIIVEPANSGIIPVSPKKTQNFLIACFLGFALPFGFLWMKSALNNKIETQDDIERLTNMPVLGKIIHNPYKTRNVMAEFPKSPISESFRALRTNLDFYVRGGQKKVILVTSCFENEGKSFIAMNLAMSYAQLGRKTILVDFDLRKPKTYFAEGEETKEGLSSYMIDKGKYEDLILKSQNEKLDYLLSGILPPNPVELIALEKTEKLISQLKQNYEIVVLDTTPLAQVTDAYLLLDHADVKVLITRSRQTVKNVFSLIVKDLLQKNVRNICIVLNDNKIYSDQYGYGYGYYNKKKGSFLKEKFGQSKRSGNMRHSNEKTITR